jgi:hypothetical protein
MILNGHGFDLRLVFLGEFQGGEVTMLLTEGISRRFSTLVFKGTAPIKAVAPILGFLVVGSCTQMRKTDRKKKGDSRQGKGESGFRFHEAPPAD